MPTSKQAQDSAVHLVVRYSDRFVKGVGDTVAEHRRVLAKYGCVWIGKIGRGLRVAEFTAQLESDTPTYLYLAKPGRGGFAFTRGRVVAIRKDRPTERTECIPAYYGEHGLAESMGMWILVSDLEPVSAAERSALHTRSSGRPVTDTLYKSSAGAFFVEVLTKSQTRVAGATAGKREKELRRHTRPRCDIFLDDDDYEYKDLLDDV